MIGRLGIAVYWIGVGIAALAIIIGVLAIAFSGFGSGQMWIIALGATAIAAALSYLAGRTARYVLAGY